MKKEKTIIITFILLSNFIFGQEQKKNAVHQHDLVLAG